MLDNIPDELKSRNQWVVWRLEKRPGSSEDTKPPYSPRTGSLASSTDAHSWSSFQEAMECLTNGGGYSGLGYMLSPDDPYSFIDLDSYKPDLSPDDIARHKLIADSFKGYAEISPSGKGLHLVVKGKVPSGRRRAGIEIYSSERYMTVTGNVYRNEPIIDQSELLHSLWAELAPNEEKASIAFNDKPSFLTDNEVCERAASAINGKLFVDLYSGNWQITYPSQSEADFALIDIIAHYTQNKEQIRRIFRASQLGQRPKAMRHSYLDHMISKSQDNQPPEINIDALQKHIESAINNPKPVLAHNGVEQPLPEDDVYSLPPGLLGEIAQYIYQAAPRPVKEIALAGAIGLMSGMCGRAYNVSDTGLNHYLLLLAPTGSGKEAMASGISKLMNEVTKRVPSAADFMGPEEIRSDAALLKYVAKHNSFLSLLGEFGQTMQQMSSVAANTHLKALKKVLLNLYAKSGKGDVLRPTIWSDADSSTKTILSPAFSLLGESAPESFYEAVDERLIADGLLTRFTIIEYTGNRPGLNAGANCMPTEYLVQRVAAVAAHCLTMNASNNALNMRIDASAQTVLDSFEIECTKHINSDGAREVTRHIWNRAHLRALKLAALVSVGIHPFEPVITLDAALWAIKLSSYNTHKLLAKFELGETGSVVDDNKQLKEILRVLKDYLLKDWGYIGKYSDSELMHKARIVPYGYINKRLAPTASFRLDRLGGTGALKRAIQGAIDNGYIVEVNKQETFNKFNSTAKCYAVKDVNAVIA